MQIAAQGRHGKYIPITTIGRTLRALKGCRYSEYPQGPNGLREIAGYMYVTCWTCGRTIRLERGFSSVRPSCFKRVIGPLQDHFLTTYNRGGTVFSIILGHLSHASVYRLSKNVYRIGNYSDGCSLTPRLMFLVAPSDYAFPKWALCLLLVVLVCGEVNFFLLPNSPSARRSSFPKMPTFSVDRFRSNRSLS